MNSRRQNWPTLLAVFVESRRSLPCVYGINDCCMFSADAILEMTGEDLALPYRGSYSNLKGAVRVAKKIGGLEKVVDELLSRVPVKLAQRGDVVLGMDDAHNDALGICLGDLWCTPGVTQLVFRPMSVALIAWRV